MADATTSTTEQTGLRGYGQHSRLARKIMKIRAAAAAAASPRSSPLNNITNANANDSDVGNNNPIPQVALTSSSGPAAQTTVSATATATAPAPTSSPSPTATAQAASSAVSASTSSTGPAIEAHPASEPAPAAKSSTDVNVQAAPISVPAPVATPSANNHAAPAAPTSVPAPAAKSSTDATLEHAPAPVTGPTTAAEPDPTPVVHSTPASVEAPVATSSANTAAAQSAASSLLTQALASASTPVVVTPAPEANDKDKATTAQAKATPTPADGEPRTAPVTAPGSPRLMPIRQNSGSSTPRIRPPATTLNIPGMTRSLASPDGRIASRDVGAKLVIVMVGLPARGKSYITKKLRRYLAWQQHNTRIFNVGNRRRVAAGKSTGPSDSPPNSGNVERHNSMLGAVMDAPTQAAHILLNGVDPKRTEEAATSASRDTTMDQSAEFFDPTNSKASQLREQVALSTLDELLDFLLDDGGSVGILDATNSTVARRKLIFDRIKERESKLGILFIESVCEDKDLLEANMRLKLSGPDYKDKDPVKSLKDFKKRVAAYESAYVPLGKFEEDSGMQYIQMIDVGRKVVHYQLKGFLAGGIASYLSTFNLAPRQIWITRHGQSIDNVQGKLGGNSSITEKGKEFGEALYTFICDMKNAWLIDQKSKILASNFPPHPGDNTPPYPDSMGELDEKNFCVWTSMLKRSIETAEKFQEDTEFDVKNWEMLNELNAGDCEGMTYQEVAAKFPEEYAKRGEDKLHYTYPGLGGEGYLQVISRLRDMVREIERITDHVLIIGHRSVARVLMAYFMDLTRDDIAHLDVPLGMLYSIETRPYGIDFHAYKYDETANTFNELPNYKPHQETEPGN
ncbi:6-phosphofructo-2-kinase 1 [Phlyctema vagabunda]|uniref:6-phosphofructo-2-kinase 1 n=1 Tax=Phlyctema vagabunda TaxID=108571 RepID=A0ABR4PW47_9HELO